MATKYQYVKQCSCCDDRFSRINLPAINAKHQGALTKMLKKQVTQMRMKGDFSLMLADGVIAGFYYQYATAAEELKAEKLCNRLYDAACEFYDELMKADTVWTYGEAA